MKHWKRMLVLLMVILLLSLSACGKNPDETTAPSDSVTDTTAYEDPVPDLSGHWYDGYEVFFSSGYDGYLDGQLLYRVNEKGALCVLDLTTMEETLICAREDCTHYKAVCDAYFGYENYYIDGYLYRRSGSTLVRCRLDGTERTELLTMGKLDLGDRFYKNVRPMHFQVTESAIYYSLRAEYGVDLGDFKFATKMSYFLVRFDMESGEEEILGEFEEKDVNILAARDDQVLITALEIVEFDFEDPEWEEISNNASLSVQVWDAGYESFVTVKEDACGVFAPYEIKDGKLLYTNYKDGKHYCYDPVTETDTVLEDAADRMIYGGKYVIIYDYDIDNNYLALAETGEKVHNDFGDLRMSVCAYDEEGLVFEAVKVVRPEGQDWGEIVARTTYYVRFADMEDGLHDYDCIQLHHWEREE